MTDEQFRNLPSPVTVMEARIAVLQRYLGEATARIALMEDVLRAAVAHTELFTGNGCREQPPEWARLPDGEFNAEEIAKRGRALLARRSTVSASGLPLDASGAVEPVDQGRKWRLKPSGAWVYVNAEGTSIGNVYRNDLSGVWTGDPWGRTIEHFETAQEAKTHVEAMFRR